MADQNELKRSFEDEDSSDFGPPKKRFRDMHLHEDADSISSIPLLASEESQGSGDSDSGYFPELGPHENLYYLQNKLLFDLHVEREHRKHNL
ncbi:uncharacterized protein [Drosophila takahashii]|uniref:uncharacterized protein n=1 Tax=Drosophila takahashii TaxID=29030 RepID=UPI003899444A